MKEQYPYGACHNCHCPIATPGADSFYCPRCGKWMAYPKLEKFNNSSQPRPALVYSQPVFQPDLKLEGGEP
jgi:hypothetical protein